MEKKKRIHWFQHVDFEGLGNIEEWINKNEHIVSKTTFFSNYILPKHTEYDVLIIMGGPMSTYEENKYLFLREEKEFVKEAIKLNKKVLGICLGSQIIADVLGAKVYPNKYKEIGWYPVKVLNSGEKSLFSVFQKEMTVFHWHGDTFDIPEDAIWTIESEGCKNQAFEYNDGKVAGLQFHIEMNNSSIDTMLEVGHAELTEGKYISSAIDIVDKNDNIEKNKKTLFLFLDKFINNDIV